MLAYYWHDVNVSYIPKCIQISSGKLYDEHQGVDGSIILVTDRKGVWLRKVVWLYLTA
jgi:hypothetical protein